MNFTIKNKKLFMACASALVAMSHANVNALEINEQQTQDQALTFTLITGDKVNAVVDSEGGLSGIRVAGVNGEDRITSVFKRGDNVYVIPEDAQNLVDNQSLDMELFNLTKLHASGYDDTSTAQLPVIVEYHKSMLRGPAIPHVLPGTSLKSELEIIDSAAINIEKAQVVDVIQQLLSDSSVEGVWLDAKVHAHDSMKGDTLTPTVPLTGAYGNYANLYKGEGVKVAVLDSGYDIEHSDLAGRVVASQAFVYPQIVDDISGHGTHVATTIAGTGNASGGKWVGVAPGAELIIGKVLDNTGAGSTSGILNGMIWAVNSGANIVNMSLGGSGSACDGPLVDAVEALSDQALFVISAGNSFTRESIGVPGCAPSALTVGAIDRDNNTAVFSSRGPSPDGHSAKPDIASQGVDVVAGAVGGAGNLAYVSMSGTSMAAPHVSGGAAIVLQARPELTPRELKQVLTSSVVDSRSHVLEQGAGPMDVNRAIVQPVIAAPNQELAHFEYEGNTEVYQTHITLRNISDADVTLKVRMELIGEDGKTKLPATLAGLGVKSVTIAANSTLDVPVWIDPTVALRNSAYGSITGRIKGTSTGKQDVQLTVPFSFWIEQPMVNLTVSAVDRFGQAAATPSKFYIMNAEDEWGSYSTFVDGSRTLRVPKGKYSVVANIMTFDNPKSGGLVESAAMMAKLGQKVDGDTQIQFDAGQATKVEFKTDKPIDTQGFSFGFTYALDDNKLIQVGAYELAPDYVNEMYGWSQGRDDRLTSFVSTRAYAPEAVLTTDAGTIIDYINPSAGLSFNGKGSEELVYAGVIDYATDWSKVNIAGKVALVDTPFFLTSQLVGQLMDKGAVGILANRPGTDGRYKPNLAGTPKVPVAMITASTAERLKEELDKGSVTLSWSGNAPEYTPYAYSLNHVTKGAVDSGLIRIKDHKLGRVDASYYSTNDARPAWTDVMASMGSLRNFYSTGSPQMLMLPNKRVEYFSVDDSISWTNVVMPAPFINSQGALFDGPRRFVAGEHDQTTWFKAARGAALYSSGTPLVNRSTNQLRWGIPAYGDAAGHDGIVGYNSTYGYAISVNGEQVSLAQGILELGDETNEISYTVNYYLRGMSVGSESMGSENLTEFTFQTDVEAQGPQAVLVPRLDLPLAMDNTYPANQPMAFTLAGVTDAQANVELTEVKVRYSYGKECRLKGGTYCETTKRVDLGAMQDASVEQVNGQWVATIPNDTEAGNFVHLHLELMGANGSSVTQSVIRAYQVK